MVSFIADLGSALRGLKNSPGFSLGAMATLALGIGATSSVFSVVNAVLLAPLPYSQPEQLQRLFVDNERSGTDSLSFFEYEDLRRDASGFEGVTVWTGYEGSLYLGDGASRHVRGTLVSADFIPVLGVQPWKGRGFTADEDREGGPRSIVLSYRLWSRVFGGAEQALGTVVELDQRPHTIVGVMPQGFYFPSPDTEFWIPLRGNELLKMVGINNPNRGLSWLSGLARLRSGSPPERLEREIETISEEFTSAAGTPRRLRLVPLRESIAGETRSLLTALLGAVGLVLLIACANVANLSLARAWARRREMALRSALGGRRIRLMRQLMCESSLLSLLGGLAGILIALGMTRWMAALEERIIPRQQEISLDWRVVAFTLGAAALSAVIFGLVPALQTSKPDLQSELKDGVRTAGMNRSGRRLQGGLAVVQIALALMLLIGAGLLARSYLRLTSLPLGFQPENLLTISLSLPDSSYPSSQEVMSFYSQLRAELQGLPGVESAATSYSLPFQGVEFQQTIQVEGREADEEQIWAGTVIASPGYFRTLGVPLVMGRDFEDEDRWDSPRVAIVNRAMAERLWPQGEVIGKRFRRSGGVTGSIESVRYLRRDWITVIGVTENERRSGYAQPPGLEYFVPHAQLPWSSQSVAIRSSSDPLALVEPARRQLELLDPRVAPTQVTTLRSSIDRSVLQDRFRAQVLALFALASSGLSALGVYAVLAFAVSHRTAEIGVRMALGAQRSQVVSLVLRQGLRLAFLGAVLGLAGAWVFSQTLSSLLFEVEALDPLSYALACLAMMAAAVAACLLPAMRASRIDPLRALRCD